jgi:hypothetical protein
VSDIVKRGLRVSLNSRELVVKEEEKQTRERDKEKI